MSNFTDFLKEKLLNIINNKLDITETISTKINKLIQLTTQETNLFINDLNNLFGINQYEILTTIPFEDIFLVFGNTINVKKGFLMFVDENNNTIPVSYENATGIVTEKKIFTTYNKDGIEADLPEFLEVKADRLDFIISIVRDNNNIYLLKFNEFISTYSQTIQIFNLKVFKINDLFIYGENNQFNFIDSFVNDFFIIFEPNFTNNNFIEIVATVSPKDLKWKTTLLSIDIDELKIVITANIDYELDATVFNKNVCCFGFGFDNNNKFYGSFAFQRSTSGVYVTFLKITQSEIEDFLIDYEIVNSGIAISNLFNNKTMVSISPNEIFYMSVVFVGIYIVVLNVFNLNKTGTQRIQRVYSFDYDIIELAINTTEQLNSFCLSKAYDKQQRKYLICGTGLGLDGETAIAKNISFFIYQLSLDNEYYYSLSSFDLNPNFDNFYFMNIFKQQNRFMITTYTNNYSLSYKFQNSYNLGNEKSSPYFFERYNNDFNNFNISHIIGAKTNSENPDQLSADIDILEFGSANNNLVYSGTLEKNTMNYIGNNFWFLISNSNQFIFIIEYNVSKSNFEKKTLNFNIGINFYLEDLITFNNEYASSLNKIFTNKKDIEILNSVAISKMKFFFKNDIIKEVNILGKWIFNRGPNILIIDKYFYFQNKDNIFLKYQLLSETNIVVYEKEFLNFDMSKSLNIKHKIYYNN